MGIAEKAMVLRSDVFLPILGYGFALNPTIQVVDRIKEEVEGVKLEDAEVVVSGGRGIGSAQNFEMIRELARVLGGAIGATRPACDEGWVPVTLQVGQSGKVVSPKLYIAVALSGAMSHIAGHLGSKVIVAINKDKEANIFNVAHFGIVAAYKEVLPSLDRKIEGATVKISRRKFVHSCKPKSLNLSKGKGRLF